MLGISFLLNTWVNPLWVSPAPWSSPDFADYKPIHKHPRTGKAGLAQVGGWKHAIIGSSRLDIALDPRNPLWEGESAVNLGLRGGNLCEFAPMLRVTADHNDLETVVLGVDHYDLTSEVLIPNEGAFLQSPLAVPSSRSDRTFRYYLGGSTTTFSIKALNYRAKGRLASYDHLGQWVESLDGRPFRAIFTTDSLPQAVTWIRRSRHSLEAIPQKVAALEDILETCRSRGIRLVIFIPPNHATYLATFFLSDAPDPTFDTNRRLLFDAVARSDVRYPDAPPVQIWDFCDFHPVNCEPLPAEDSTHRMDRWIDGTHATTMVGDWMLHCALRGAPLTPIEGAGPFGTLIDEESIETQPESIRSGYERYRSEHPADHQWSARLLSETIGE